MLSCFAALIVPLLVESINAALCSKTCRVKDELPPGLNCGKGGTLARPASSGYSYVTNIYECIKICTDPAYHCASFAYSERDSYCYLYIARLIDMGYYQRRKDVDGKKYYNRNCFSCSYTEECQPPKGNAVVNGGFECGNGQDLSPWYSEPGSLVLQDCAPSFQHPLAGSCSATFTAYETPVYQRLKQSVCNELRSYTFEMLYGYQPTENLTGAPTLMVSLGGQTIIHQNVCGPTADLGNASSCDSDSSDFKRYSLKGTVTPIMSPSELFIEVGWPSSSNFKNIYVDQVRLY